MIHGKSVKADRQIMFYLINLLLWLILLLPKKIFLFKIIHAS